MATPERSYSESHRWISFRLDLAHAGAEFWMLLGEARSKVEHLSLALLKPEIAEQMHRVYLAKGAQATTAIEGNTLSEDEVANIVAGRAAPPPPSQEYLYREVENIVTAFSRIKDHLVAGGDARLTPDTVRTFNRDVLEGLDQDDVHPGEFRRHSVVVRPYRGAPWQDCEYLVERLCAWLESEDFDPPNDEWAIPYAVLKAMIAHLYIAWIHPFDDGNGRTARLMELQILLAAGVPMPATHLLSNHYNATRTEYYRRLQEASESGGDVVPFLRYAVHGFVDGLRAQIERVWEQQYTDRWEQFVYETFGGRTTTETARRRLQLVLELSKRDEPVARRDIPSLSLELGLAYVGTERMVGRDLNALASMNLIEQARHGYWRAKREQILAFRPLRRENLSE
jgi:Fic family protein